MTMIGDSTPRFGDNEYAAARMDLMEFCTIYCSRPVADKLRHEFPEAKLYPSIDDPEGTVKVVLLS